MLVVNVDSSIIHSRFFAPVAVVVVAAFVIGISTFIQVDLPKASEGAVTIEPIGSSVLLCPEPGTGGDLGVRVTAAVVPGQPGQDTGTGSAGIETLPGKESASSRITAPGEQGQI